MTISVPLDKIQKIVSLASCTKSRGGCTADELRSFLGRIESVRPAIETAPLHYRSLQEMMPRRRYWSGQTFLPLTDGAQEDLLWWIHTFPLKRSGPLSRGPISLQVSTDASSTGWGGTSSRGAFQGEWEGEERDWHINKKEIVAATRCLSLSLNPGDYVQLSMDSKTAVAFVNRKGGKRSQSLCKAALEFWQMVLSRDCWVKAAWLPREDNTFPDMLSKHSILTWEFALDPLTARDLWRRWFLPAVDCFASSMFHQLAAYYSFAPDANAAQRDAFSVVRWPNRVYAFPPVPLIPLTLKKIKEDHCWAIMVVPHWTNAKWWDMLQEEPFTLGHHKQVLTPGPLGRLPFLGTLVACLLKG